MTFVLGISFVDSCKLQSLSLERNCEDQESSFRVLSDGSNLTSDVRNYRTVTDTLP